MTTEDETLKINEISETETNISEQSTKESFSSQLPNVNTQNWYLHPLFQRYYIFSSCIKFTAVLGTICLHSAVLICLKSK
jgi:hypothetical protein